MYYHCRRDHQYTRDHSPHNHFEITGIQLLYDDDDDDDDDDDLFKH